MLRAVGVILLVASLSTLGCEKFFTSSERPDTPSIARSFAPVVPADGLVVEKILLERPLGDSFLDRELWEAVQPVGTPETRALLSENGIRVGLLTGILPPQFQTMVATKADVSGTPELMTFNNRKEAVIPTAGPIESCNFDLLGDLAGRSTSVSLKNVRCGVMVRPQAAGEGRVKLWCEPQLQHGSREQRYRPSEDGTQFTTFEEVPTEKYAGLGFEVPLQADECLLIGCIAEQQGRLGVTLFSAEASGNPRQRLLVIRARQVNTNATADLPTITPPGRRPAAAGSTTSR